MTDFHTHLLPGIDDGIKDATTSVKILSEMKENGVSVCALTPHFNIEKTSIEDFLLKRQQCFDKLMLEIKNTNAIVPKLLLGAEIAFDYRLCDIDNFDKLFIEGTSYALLEFPYSNWRAGMFENLERIIMRNNFIPIIAHMERYIGSSGHIPHIDKLLTFEVLPQINAKSVIKPQNRKIKKLLKKGVFKVLGSDVHNETTRPANVHLGYEVLQKKYKKTYPEFEML